MDARRWRVLRWPDHADRRHRRQRRAADIVVHYVPTAGGVVFGGYAICGDHGCPNILVRSDLPPSLDRDPYDPEYLGWVTLHELGHALGLGHATNLLESTDLMGYGWPDYGEPVLSDCDVDALAYVFAWALNGTAPEPPGAGPYDCSRAEPRRASPAIGSEVVLGADRRSLEARGRAVAVDAPAGLWTQAAVRGGGPPASR